MPEPNREELLLRLGRLDATVEAADLILGLVDEASFDLLATLKDGQAELAQEDLDRLSRIANTLRTAIEYKSFSFLKNAATANLIDQTQEPAETLPAAGQPAAIPAAEVAALEIRKDVQDALVTIDGMTRSASDMSLNQLQQEILALLPLVGDRAFSRREILDLGYQDNGKRMLSSRAGSFAKEIGGLRRGLTTEEGESLLVLRRGPRGKDAQRYVITRNFEVNGAQVAATDPESYLSPGLDVEVEVDGVKFSAKELGMNENVRSLLRVLPEFSGRYFRRSDVLSLPGFLPATDVAKRAEAYTYGIRQLLKLLQTPDGVKILEQEGSREKSRFKITRPIKIDGFEVFPTSEESIKQAEGGAEPETATSRSDVEIVIDGQTFSADRLGISLRGMGILRVLPEFSGRSFAKRDVLDTSFYIEGTDDQRSSAFNNNIRTLVERLAGPDGLPVLGRSGYKSTGRYHIRRQLMINGQLVEASDSELAPSVNGFDADSFVLAALAEIIEEEEARRAAEVELSVATEVGEPEPEPEPEPEEPAGDPEDLFRATVDDRAEAEDHESLDAEEALVLRSLGPATPVRSRPPAGPSTTEKPASAPRAVGPADEGRIDVSGLPLLSDKEFLKSLGSRDPSEVLEQHEVKLAAIGVLEKGLPLDYRTRTVIPLRYGYLPTRYRRESVALRRGEEIISMVAFVDEFPDFPRYTGLDLESTSQVLGLTPAAILQTELAFLRKHSQSKDYEALKKLIPTLVSQLTKIKGYREE